jgi:hypothetical protein
LPQNVETKSLWEPQRGPQAAFVASTVFEVIYGGARGGGKTDAALGDFALHAADHGAGAKGLLVRRTRTALTPTIARARQIYTADGAAWNEARSCFVWPSGAILYFRHLDRDADADLYQGHDYSRVYVEELTQFPDPRAVDKLKATLRSATGVPCGFRATCNPGGAGHAWVKARYIDAGPYQVVSESFVNPFDGATSRLDRVFIPARLMDNPLLMERDPNYVARLAQSGSAELVRAWLEGDWSVVQGAFFSEWSGRNILAPFEVPSFWTRFRSFDWGYAAPFSVGWWAVVSETIDLRGRRLPRGALVRYREWYGSSGRRNEGLRMVAEAVAAGILERQGGEQVIYGIADPSIFREDGGPSIAERMRRPHPHRADPPARRRPARGSRHLRRGPHRRRDPLRLPLPPPPHRRTPRAPHPPRMGLGPPPPRKRRPRYRLVEGSVIERGRRTANTSPGGEREGPLALRRKANGRVRGDGLASSSAGQV